MSQISSTIYKLKIYKSSGHQAAGDVALLKRNSKPLLFFGQRLTLTTLGHCERPPTRAPLAPLARPESVDVHNAQVSSDLAVLVKKRLILASLGSSKTPAYSDFARSACEALVGGRFW
ncbi:hypothetical protein TYRP_016771 [Tyrophagus putrescentiae]|nr:hypothetical protein TYRP_016771 [Tyrophagus putrescentiae]